MAAPLSSDRPQNQAPKRILRRMKPHMDFTPMVDLGFLLITFFMLTTSLSKPNVMPLVMPDDSGETEPTKQSKVLTLLLGNEGKIYWYEGLEVGKMDTTTFDRKGLREVILHKMQKVQDQFGLQYYEDHKTGAARQGSHLNVIIKPTQYSNYKNLVDALDEMNICHVRYYCIVEPNNEEGDQLHLR